MKNFKVLIIDDQPLITESYKQALDSIEQKIAKINFDLDISYSCESALEKILNYRKKNIKLDLAIIEINLPPSKDGSILSGECLGIKIRNLLENTKIIISTALKSNYILYHLFQSLNPDGFIIKKDVCSKSLKTAIENVLNDKTYYSNTVLNLLRREVSNQFVIDSLDRKLLYELSKGTMMKDLPKILMLSLPAIEKRKRKLRKKFNLINSQDKDLLSVARSHGFI